MKNTIPIAAVVAALAIGCGDGHQHGDGHDHGAAAHTHADTPVPAAKPAEPAAQPAPAVAEKTDAAKAPTAFDEKPAVGTKATCPVMKNEFVVSETTDHSEHGGKHYAFCCPGCKPQFDADPKKFTGG